MDASSYIRSGQKENICLFCGEPVEYGWVSDYKGTKVWICRNCVIEGELGELMATAIFDRDYTKQDREVVEDINRCLETTQLKFYKNTLQYTFRHSEGLKPEVAKEKIGTEEIKETEGEKGIEERQKEEIAARLEKDKSKPDEKQLLRYLSDWKSIKDIQQQFNVGYKPLLEKLDEMYQKGEVDKKKVKIETGGTKYKYKRIEEENVEESDPYNGSGTYEDKLEERENFELKTDKVPQEEQLLRYLSDWKSIKDIQQQFNVGYKPLQEILNRLFFSGHLLKKTVPKNPMYKKAAAINEG